MAIIPFHNLFPMRETHSRHHSLFELTILLEHRAPLRAAQLAELDAPSSLKVPPRQPLLKAAIVSAARPHAARGRLAQRRRSMFSENLFEIRQKLQAVQQVYLIVHDLKHQSRKSTKLRRSCGTSFAPCYAVQCERAPAKQVDNKPLAVFK